MVMPPERRLRLEMMKPIPLTYTSVSVYACARHGYSKRFILLGLDTLKVAALSLPEGASSITILLLISGVRSDHGTALNPELLRFGLSFPTFVCDCRFQIQGRDIWLVFAAMSCKAAGHRCWYAVAWPSAVLPSMTHSVSICSPQVPLEPTQGSLSRDGGC